MEGPRALVRAALRWVRSRFGSDAGPDVLAHTPQEWESQYAAGNWDFLTKLPELPRYSVLAGFVAHLGRGGAVLDVGCGQGILLRTLPDGAYSQYVGVDLAASAVAAARQQQIERSSFCVGDCETFAPDPVQKFNVIVFNEVLYYLREPVELTERYLAFLESDGVLLVSMCTAARGSAAILGKLKRRYRTVAETVVSDSATRVAWTCAAFSVR